MPKGPTRRELLAGSATVALGWRELGEARAAHRHRLTSAAVDFSKLRDGYDLSPGLTYLNHASIGTTPTAVREALQSYQTLCESNPWLHVWGGAWDEGLADVRSQAAAFLGGAPEEIALTHNTTEAFNTLARGLALGEGDEVLFSSLNHTGASQAWFHAAEARGFSVRRFDFPLEDVPSLSRADVVELHRLEIGERTRVLVLPHIDNVVGLLHPVRELASMARRNGVELVAVDGAQSAGMIPVDVAELGADFYATSGHKWIQAPKATGIFHASAERLDDVRPLVVTWGQARWSGTARRFEDYGTRDLASVLALGDALAFQARIEAAPRAAHHQELREHARRRVEANPRLSWRSPLDGELGAPALYAVGVRGVGAQELADTLYSRARTVVRPFRLRHPGPDPSFDALRLSPNVMSSRADLDHFFEALEAALG